MMKFLIPTVLVLITLGLASCTKDKVSKVPTPEGYYENQWNEALAAAQDYDRKIYVQFYAEWCSLCATFKQDVLNDDEVELYLKDNFVPVLLDSENGIGKEIYEQNGLTAHPLSVMFDKDGQLIGERAGAMSKETFLQWIKPFE